MRRQQNQKTRVQRRLQVRSTQRLATIIAVATPLLCLGPAQSRADEPIWATGHVADADGQPLVNAVVAVYDDSNHVVDYARTDRNGDYALAVPPRALHLEHKHGKGFLAEVFGGVTRFVGESVDFMANPVRAGVRAVTSSEAAAFTDPVTRGGIAVGGAVVDRALFAVSPKPKTPIGQLERKQPGAMVVKVIAPDHNDLLGIAHVYWVQDEVSRLGGKQKRTTAAWLDPIQLTSSSTEKPSKVESDYLRFTGARLVPSLVEPGQTVHVYARLKTPPAPATPVVVVARNDRTGEKWEMTPSADGLYAAEFTVDRKFPHDDQHISILAYAALEQKPGRRLDAEHAIEGDGLWNPKESFVYDPLLVVSRNRVDLTLTVIPGDRRGHR
jgi:hypothetical protein